MRALHARLKRDSASAKASGRRGGRRETDREEYVREIYFGGSLRGIFLDRKEETNVTEVNPLDEGRLHISRYRWQGENTFCLLLVSVGVGVKSP